MPSHREPALVRRVRSIVIVVGGLIGATRAFADCPIFDSPVMTLPVGNDAHIMISADLNGDGRPDYVTANIGIDALSVVLSTGTSGFAPHVEVATGDGPFDVAVADLNHDGHLDLVTANAGGNSISVLLGTGGGGFAPHVDLFCGPRPQAVAAADLNGDGSVDIVAANAFGTEVQIFMGHGDGTFPPASPLNCTGTPAWVGIADFDGDGALDLVVSHMNFRTLDLWRGSGNGGGSAEGGFSLVQVLPTSTGPVSGCISDLNGDGHPDVVLSNNGAQAVSVFLGRADGTLAPRVDHGPIGQHYDVIAADANMDGRPDLISANPDAATVSVFLGQGDGTFEDGPEWGVLQGPIGVAVADFTGDGVPDVAVSHSVAPAIAILAGSAQGGFHARQDFEVGASPLDLAVGDLDADGRPDAVVATPNGFIALKGHPDGTLSPLGSLDPGGYGRTVALGDVNLDGKLDIVAGRSLPNALSVFLGDGDGTFQPRQDMALSAAPTRVRVVDLNGDGWPDAAMCGVASSPLVALGDGSGTLTQVSAGPGAYVQAQPEDISVSDFDLDGRPDLVLATGTAGVVRVLRGLGDGTFVTATGFFLGGSSVGVTSGDLDGDGLADVVGTGIPQSGGAQTNQRVAVSFGSGGGQLTAPQTYLTGAGSSPNSVTLADLNHDGIVDVSSTDVSRSVVSVRLGHAGRVLADPLDFAVGVRPNRVVAADMNGDGRADLLVTNESSGTLSVLLAEQCGLLAVPPIDPPLSGSISDLRVGPDPCRASASITFAWAGAGPVDIEVFDCQGRRVATVARRQELAPGPHAFAWGLTSASNVPVSAGLYLVRVRAHHEDHLLKLVVAR